MPSGEKSNENKTNKYVERKGKKKRKKEQTCTVKQRQMKKIR